MRRSLAVLLLAVAACTSAPSEDALPEALIPVVRREVAAGVRPVGRKPIGAPSGDGDAGADYAAARLALQTLPAVLDDKTRLEEGRFPRPRALPAAVTRALETPAVAAVVDAVVRGAGRTHVTSPYAIGASLGQRDDDLAAVADLVVMAARARTAAGQAPEGGAMLLALARMGQDLRRGASLRGHIVGARIERRAAQALVALLREVAPPPAAMAALGDGFAALLAAEPTPVDALVDGARHRLALAGVASGLPLAVGWKPYEGAEALADWRAAFGGIGAVAPRIRAELDALRAIAAAEPAPAAAEIERATDHACAGAWRPDFAPCARQREALAQLVADRVELHAAAAVVALFRHHAEHGALPATLAALGALPVDPRTGAAFEYTVEASSARLSSAAAAGPPAIDLVLSPTPRIEMPTPNAPAPSAARRPPHQ